MESSFWIPLVLFIAKLLIVFLFIAILLLIVAAIVASSKNNTRKSSLLVFDWQKDLKKLQKKIFSEILSKKELKHWQKAAKKQKTKGKHAQQIKRLYLLNFDGDIQANNVLNFRKEISLILSIAKKEDAAMIRVNSKGGTVTGYGQAVAELSRLKGKVSTIFAAVDQFAASGGYLLSAVADKIVAAPFAIVGSIGVAAEVPNLHNLLKKKGIDYEVYTAGKYKRTISFLGKNTKEGVEQFNKDLKTTHKLFQDYIKKHRPQLNLNKVSTGQWWYGSEAIKLNLIDEIATSEQLLYEMSKDYNIIELSYKKHNHWTKKVAASIDTMIHSLSKPLLSSIEHKIK